LLPLACERLLVDGVQAGDLPLGEQPSDERVILIAPPAELRGLLRLPEDRLLLDWPPDVYVLGLGLPRRLVDVDLASAVLLEVREFVRDHDIEVLRRPVESVGPDGHV